MSEEHIIKVKELEADLAFAEGRRLFWRTKATRLKNERNGLKEDNARLREAALRAYELFKKLEIYGRGMDRIEDVMCEGRVLLLPFVRASKGDE